MEFYRIEREEKPEEEKLQDLGLEEIVCADCGERPVIIQKVKDTPNPNKFKMLCFCGGSSFVCGFMGKVYIAAKPGFYLEDIEYGKISIIKVKKCKK